MLAWRLYRQRNRYLGRAKSLYLASVRISQSLMAPRWYPLTFLLTSFSFRLGEAERVVIVTHTRDSIFIDYLMQSPSFCKAFTQTLGIPTPSLGIHPLPSSRLLTCLPQTDVPPRALYAPVSAVYIWVTGAGWGSESEVRPGARASGVKRLCTPKPSWFTAHILL